MAFQYSPKIVTNGLSFYVDASNTKSFVSGSTVWNDLTINSNNGTLTNGPTFSRNNGGSIVFDGVDDRVNLVFKYLGIRFGNLSKWRWFN